MKFQVKEYSKESFYKINDWVSDIMLSDDPSDSPSINLIDWNEWDYEKQSIKSMFIEIPDPRLAIIFKLTMGEYLE
jgi:hypothetical protein